jgi:hypothetical protein
MVVSGNRHDSHQSLISRLRWGDGTPAEIPTSSAEEPCLACGQETAIGSMFFSDRRETAISDGTRVYMCSDCQAMAHRARKGQPLTDEELRIIAKNGFMVGAGFVSGGGGVGGF